MPCACSAVPGVWDQFRIGKKRLVMDDLSVRTCNGDVNLGLPGTGNHRYLTFYNVIFDKILMNFTQVQLRELGLRKILVISGHYITTQCLMGHNSAMAQKLTSQVFITSI